MRRLAVRLLVRGTARIHSPYVWRALYWLLRRPSMVRLAAWALRCIARRRGDEVATRVLAQVAAELAWAGWPIAPGAIGWMNLDVSRFLARVRRELRGAGTRRARPPRPRTADEPLRVGLVAPFRGLLSFPREHFERAGSEVEIVLFDFAFGGAPAEYLADAVDAYHAFPDASSEDEHELAVAISEAVNAADLDLVLVLTVRRVVDEIVDLVDTPCVAYVCTTSDLLHNPGVDFHIFCQPQADYFVRGDRLFCGTTRALFGNERAYEGDLVLDARGLAGAHRPLWRDRDPLIVFSGSLYKLAAPRFLDCVLSLLQEDSELEFAYIGRDVHDVQASIEAAARRRGVAERVHYEGSFSAVRTGPEALEGAEGWERLCDLLRRARLAPDPWPIGGAASRVEAYLLGASTVHMGVRFDPPSWGRAQDALVELPLLLVPQGTASSVEEYRELARRCLYEEAFADLLAEKQLAVARRATNGELYWQQVANLYRRWSAEARAVRT